MSAHKKFDDYIKGMFKDDPKVPSGLAWESMNFDLPEPPKPEKESNKKYLLLLLLLLIGASAFYYSINRNDTINGQIARVSSEQSSDNDAIKNSTKSPSNFSETEIECIVNTDDVIAQENTTKQEVNNSSQVVVNSELNKTESYTKNSPSNTNVKIENAGLEYNFADDTQIVSSNDEEKLAIENTVPGRSNVVVTRAAGNSPKQTKSQVIAFLATRPIDYVDAPLETNMEEELQINVVKTNKQNGEKLSLKNEIYLGYGYSLFNLKVDAGNVLNGKITGILSKSYKGGLRLNINENWKTNLGLKYEQFHSTFEHSRDLQPIIDFPNLKRINREELTFHNNYTNTLGLQIGVERYFQVTESVSLYAGLGLSPTYIISSKGKTLADIDDEISLYDNKIGSFSLNAGLSAGLVLPLNRFANVELNYQFNRFLVNEVFINEGVNSNQQSVLSVIVSYKFN